MYPSIYSKMSKQNPDTKPVMTHLPSFIHLMMILLIFLSKDTATIMAQNTTTTNPVEVKVGVILDLDSEFGKMELSSINMSLTDFYASHSNYSTRLVLNTRDSKGDVVGAAAAALDLIKNEQVQAIVGAVSSMQTHFVIDLGNKSQVPIFSFSATSPSLTSIRSPYFFRGIQNDSSQVSAIAAIIQAFGWREAVPIYVDDEYGEGIIPYLTDALQEINVRVPYRSVISPSATDDQISEELYKLLTMQTRVFILHMLPSLGSRLFKIADRISMMNESCVWIITDGMTNFLHSMDNSVIDSMQGVLGVKRYVPETTKTKEFRVRWKRKFQMENPKIIDAQLNIFDLLAYDATFSLAMAVEKAGITNSSFAKTNASRTTDLDAIGISQNGPKLINALSNTEFKGLTGDYSFVDGQLQPLAFQIVNVNGDGSRGVGFWMPDKGLTKNLNAPVDNKYPSSRSGHIGPIIWPGESTSVPKGWEIPTSEKKLRVGVPVKNGFSDFVKVTTDQNNVITVTGYSVAVFEAVMQALPYAVSFEYVPFWKLDGIGSGTYDDMVYEVYQGNYDVVVGDTTIVANRSQYVDFTLPYTESGVSMMVPIKDNNKKNAWVFLQPLTWDLWVTIAVFFAFIGFVVWVLEHRINEDFRGPAQHQVGTSFWFSFSTMVFAQRERVFSNLARFVMIVWCFVVLILTQSYTASLTSMLTVQQLQPTVTSIKQLLIRGENVGYQKGSFVYGLLRGLGFEDSKLKIYSSLEEGEELFLKESANGGIAAAFDEVPYIKMFLTQYCSKYTTIEPKFKTAGFGFAFPIGSPLVSDVSKAILNVTEGDKLSEIENQWFKKEASCPDPSNTPESSESLGIGSFYALFIITGIVSSSALIICISKFVYKHKHVLKNSDPEMSAWMKFRMLLRIFISRDLSAHTFKPRSNFQTSPQTNFPASPSSFSQHTDSHFALYGNQGSPSTENGDSTHNRNRQAPQDMESDIELANPDQEIPRTP